MLVKMKITLMILLNNFMKEEMTWNFINWMGDINILTHNHINKIMNQ